MYRTTLNDDNLKNGLALSGGLHLLLFLFLFFGLPHLVPPLPAHHEPVPFDIVTIADITNTRLENQEPQPPPPAEPPKPQPAPPIQEKPQPPAPTPPAPPQPQAEAIKPIEKPKPQEKPKPVEQPKPQPDMLASVLKDVSKLKQPPAPAETKTATNTNAPAATAGPSLSSRLSITEEDALRRQIEQCWNPPIGARDAQTLVVEVVINVNQDRTVADADVVDKSRYASDSFFRAAADAAMRAVRNPKCSPLLLPEDKYDQWKRIDFTFDPRDML